MHVSDILTEKGRTDVTTIAPEETMEAAARMLHDKHIGALIVSSDGETIVGVLSERDIARSIAPKGRSEERRVGEEGRARGAPEP